MATPEMIKLVRERYPQYAWLINHAEVGPILERALDPNTPWSAEDLQGALVQTGWWRGTQASARQWQQLGETDPSTRDAQMRERQAQIWDAALSLGIPPNVELIQRLAEESLRLGWGEAQLSNALVVQLQYKPGMAGTTGSVQTDMARIKTMAEDEYMVPLSEQTAFEFARSIAAGEKKLDDLNVYFREQAKSKYATLVPFLDRGYTTKQFFDPYRETIAKTLEMNPAEVNFLDDPRWAKIIDNTDEAGNRGPMTQSELASYLRSQDEWAKTRQGQESIGGLGEFILGTFGKVAA